MSGRQHLVRACGRRRTLCGVVAAVLFALVPAGCAGPWGNDWLGPSCPSADERPGQVQTVQDFIGAERPR